MNNTIHLLALLTATALGSLTAAPSVLNPGFETGSLSSWVYSASGVQYSSTNARTGVGCVAFTAHGTVLQIVKGLAPNTSYRLVGYGKLATAGSTWIGVDSYGGAKKYATVTSYSYQAIDILFTTGATNTSALIWMGNGSANISYGDDFSVVPAIAPASDPLNTGGWISHNTLSDEFNGTALDSTKWLPSIPTSYWLGRAPSQFDPGNVSVSGGLLHLLMINQNLLANGSFESGTMVGWSATNSTISTLQGGEASNYTYGCKLNGTASIEQVVTGLKPNTTYQLAGFMKVGTGTQVTLGVRNQGTAAKSTAKTTTGWYPAVGFQFTTGPASTSATIYITNTGGTGTVYCDEVSLIPATLASGYKLASGYYLSASSVQSKNEPVYGYYEARMKAAKACSASAFWFQAPALGALKPVELDVCELVGKPIHINTKYPHYEYDMPINTHYFASSSIDIKNPGRATAATPVADQFHIYGVNWQPNLITFYLDGVQVWQITQLQPPAVPTADGQTQVQRLKWMFFDTEIFAYYGIPEGTSDFQVDYVRVWTKP